MRETTRYIPDVREWAYEGEYDFLTEGIEDDSDSELFSDSESEPEPEHNSDEDDDLDDSLDFEDKAKKDADPVVAQLSNRIRAFEVFRDPVPETNGDAVPALAGAATPNANASSSAAGKENSNVHGTNESESLLRVDR